MEQRAQLLALLSAPGYQQFADLDGMNRPCGRVIVMRRQLLNQHEGAPQILQAVHAMPAAKWLRVKVGTAAGEASLLTDPDSTKNNTLVRDAESQQTKEGNQRYLGMNRHIALKADSGPVHAAVGIAVHVNGVTHEHALVSSKKDNALASAGCKGGDKREGTLGGRAGGPVGRRLVLGRLLDGADPKDAISAQMRRVKASFPANVKHPSHAVTRQLGHARARDRGFAKRTSRQSTPFALSNPWSANRQRPSAGWPRPPRRARCGPQLAGNL